MGRSVSMGDNAKYTYLRIILISLIVLLAVSLFKNISYPLFWADESMTVMHGKRVLEYGYPKVHDGKNMLYDLRHSNPTLGIDEKTDAFIGGANWGQYYIAAIGVKLAELSDDIFVKTAIIRTIFAIIGLAGLAILAILGAQFFYGRPAKTGFLILFVFLELISVPLVLHVREARYYPMTIFLVAFTVFVYTQYRILSKTTYVSFLILVTVSLFLLFFTFSPAYFILLATIFLFESITFTKRFAFSRRVQQGKTRHKEPFRDYMKGTLPLILSLLTASPLISFFKMFHVAEEMAKFNSLISKMDGLDIYLDNLSIIWRFFASSDFVYLAVVLKAGLLVCLALKMLRPLSFDMPKVTFSNLLTILFVVYFVVIAKIPNFLFTRYFIPLQPVLALIIILDLTVIYNFLSQYRSSAILRRVLVALFAGFVFLNISQNIEFVKGHIYELTHAYKGPLDYVLPFIKEKYKTTDNLVIATNYEETSLMYYLDSKVIIGLVGNNLDEDSRAIPDIIVYRQGVSKNFADLFSDFFNRGQYIRILLPVVDRPPNNIPELNWHPPLTHRFRTEVTDDDRAKLEIFLRM